jgi:hypothetical protein
MAVRDYSLRETELLQDAVKLSATPIKDYSMSTICWAIWNQSDYDKRNRMIHLAFDNKRATVSAVDLRYEIERLIDDKVDDLMPLRQITLGDVGIDTSESNKACLQDHMASITIKGKTAIIDLEELLKAIRYT